METRPEPAHGAQIERQKIEKEGSIGLRSQGDHLAFLFVCRFIENMLQIRGLTAQTGAVIDDLAVNLPRGKVNKTQGSPGIRTETALIRGHVRNDQLLKNVFIS